MIRTARALALATSALVAACSGGGGTSGVPAPSTTAAPQHSASGTLTIRYPSNLLRITPSGATRAPRFVDPTVGATLLLDDKPLPASGFVADAATTVTVAPGTDGTQTAQVSLLSGDSVLTVTESYGGAQLAVGSVTMYGVAPGSTVPVTATMTMIPKGIAVTSDPVRGSDAAALSQNPATPTPVSSCRFASGPWYLVPYDATNSTAFGKSLGVDGIPPVVIGSQRSDNGGTTRLATDITGAVHVLFDGANDGVNATLYVYDPTNSVVLVTRYAHFVFPLC